MHAGGIAALIAAGAFLLLVLLLAYPLIKLARALDQATLAIRSAQEGTIPLLAQAHAALGELTTQLSEVKEITDGVSAITTDVAALTAAVSATISGPLIKIASFWYGVRVTVLRRHDAKVVSGTRRERRAPAPYRRMLGRTR